VEDGQLEYEAEGEYDYEFSGEEIVDYIEENDTIVLSSGECVKNNGQFTEEDLKYLVNKSKFRKKTE
jgi:hypothetical protein